MKSNNKNGVPEGTKKMRKDKTLKLMGLNEDELFYYLDYEYTNRTGFFPDPSTKFGIYQIRPFRAFKGEPMEEYEKAAMFYNLRMLEPNTPGAGGRWQQYTEEDKAIYEARRAEYELQLLNGNIDLHKIADLGVVPYGGREQEYTEEDRALYESRRAEYESQLLTGNIDIHKIANLPFGETV